MPLKVLGSDGSGSYEDVTSAIIYAGDNGADVVNMSLGGADPSDTLLDAMEYAYNAELFSCLPQGMTTAECCIPRLYAVWDRRCGHGSQ